MDYLHSKLYLRTLAQRPDDEFAKEREGLRVAYERSREKMICILGQIRNDFPNLTIHDISHVDSLWGVTDVIIGEDYPITPLEGFVLGCAFLIHDSVLSYEAVGGKDRLRSNAYWKDTYAELVDEEKLSIAEKEKRADFDTIRYIHAKEAERIIKQEYRDAEGHSFFILEDMMLRNHFGDVIGQVAASHHWNIEKVALLPTQQNVVGGLPRMWRVNPLKLACVMRCADAGHIDMGRAPDYLYSIMHLHGISAEHWNAQNHLAVIDVDRNRKDRAIINSTHPFKEQDFQAWNVAFDAIRVLDTELKASNKLLQEKCAEDGGAFAINEVAGASTKEELAKYLKTEGWEPFEANLHIDDVAGVIAKLGGEALYGNGDMILIAIRELIQNARDAIHARYAMEEAFDGQGKIWIHIIQKGDDTYVTVSDNGVGMSENVIKNCFLNFGCSLWNSSMLKSEYVGLRSSRFKSVGKYGIGFYSIFMIAESAEVSTRVYNKGTNTTILLNFPNGLTLTPLKKTIDSRSTIVTTRITFKIDSTKQKWNSTKKVTRNSHGELEIETSFENVLKTLCAGLDTDVWYHENDQKPRRIHQDITAADFDKKQWLRDISYADDQANPNLDRFIEENCGRMDYIKKDGQICGLAAINILPSYRQDFLSIITVGGLAAHGQINNRGSEHFIGYMDSISSSADRKGIPPMKVFGAQIEQWAQEQYEHIKPYLKPENRLFIPYSISLFNVDTSDICILQLYTKKANIQYMSIKDCLKSMVSEGTNIVLILSGYIRGDRRHIETYCQLSDAIKWLGEKDILVWPLRNSSFLDVSPKNNHTLYSYIKQTAKNMDIELDEVIQENYFHTILGPCDVMWLKQKK